MSKACELVPDQSLVAQCKEIVDEYLPNIMDMIKEELVSRLLNWNHFCAEILWLYKLNKPTDCFWFGGGGGRLWIRINKYFVYFSSCSLGVSFRMLRQSNIWNMYFIVMTRGIEMVGQGNGICREFKDWDWEGRFVLSLKECA